MILLNRTSQFDKLLTMCGRFAAGHLTQTQMQEIVEGFLDEAVCIDERAPTPLGGYHIRPTDRIGIIRNHDNKPTITTAKWQITSKSGRPLINARIENHSYWKSAFCRGRCVIPALGYFEWTMIGGKKQPVFISINRNTPVLFFAGLVSDDCEGCVILTRPPADQIADIHNRMPVIVSPDDMQIWLDGEMEVSFAQQHLGTSWDGRFENHRVAPLTKNSHGAGVIEPFEPPQTTFNF